MRDDDELLDARVARMDELAQMQRLLVPPPTGGDRKVEPYYGWASALHIAIERRRQDPTAPALDCSRWWIDFSTIWTHTASEDEATKPGVSSAEAGENKFGKDDVQAIKLAIKCACWKDADECRCVAKWWEHGLPGRCGNPAPIPLHEGPLYAWLLGVGCGLFPSAIASRVFHFLTHEGGCGTAEVLNRVTNSCMTPLLYAMQMNGRNVAPNFALACLLLHPSVDTTVSIPHPLDAAERYGREPMCGVHWKFGCAMFRDRAHPLWLPWIVPPHGRNSALYGAILLGDDYVKILEALIVATPKEKMRTFLRTRHGHDFLVASFNRPGWRFTNRLVLVDSWDSTAPDWALASEECQNTTARQCAPLEYHDRFLPWYNDPGGLISELALPHQHDLVAALANGFTVHARTVVDPARPLRGTPVPTLAETGLVLSKHTSTSRQSFARALRLIVATFDDDPEELRSFLHMPDALMSDQLVEAMLAGGNVMRIVFEEEKTSLSLQRFLRCWIWEGLQHSTYARPQAAVLGTSSTLECLCPSVLGADPLRRAMASGVSYIAVAIEFAKRIPDWALDCYDMAGMTPLMRVAGCQTPTPNQELLAILLARAPALDPFLGRANWLQLCQNGFVYAVSHEPERDWCDQAIDEHDDHGKWGIVPACKMVKATREHIATIYAPKAREIIDNVFGHARPHPDLHNVLEHATLHPDLHNVLEQATLHPDLHNVLRHASPHPDLHLAVQAPPQPPKVIMEGHSNVLGHARAHPDLRPTVRAPPQATMMILGGHSGWSTFMPRVLVHLVFVYARLDQRYLRPSAVNTLKKTTDAKRTRSPSPIHFHTSSSEIQR
jgi:hypothetical protein